MKPGDREMIVAQMEKTDEKLRVAETLAKSDHVDDAISRAYYAAFHAASAALLSQGISVESHQALKTMFGVHFVRTGKIDKRYGRWLSRLKDDGENGDYDIFTAFDETDARNAISRAKEFVKALKKYLSEEPNIE